MSLNQMLLGIVREDRVGRDATYHIECNDGQRISVSLGAAIGLMANVNLKNLVGEYCELTGRMERHVFLIEGVIVIP